MYRLQTELYDQSFNLADLVKRDYLLHETYSPFRGIIPIIGELAMNTQVIVKTCPEMDHQSFIAWVDQGLAYE